MVKIGGDKSKSYKYDEGYEMNEYLSEWQCEDHRETTRLASWRKAP